MSVDSTELQRATLERKDKEELTTIAAALGVKASSRSRKAELVELILNASNARAGSAEPAPAPAEPDASAPQPETPADADAPAKNGAAAKAMATDEQAADTSAKNGAAEASESASPGTATLPATDAAGESAASPQPSRRRTARLVGWVGDETGQPTPTDVPEEPSLFDDAGDDAAKAEAKADEAKRDGKADAKTDKKADAKRDEKAEKRDDAKAEKAEKAEKSDTKTDGEKGDTATSADGTATTTTDAGTSTETAPAEGDQSGDGAAATATTTTDGAATTDSGDGARSEGEPGNRRRRRRGRDRNREDRDRQQEESFQGEPVPVAGYLDLRDEGYGFLRINGFLASRDDAYVSVRQVRQFGLRKGDYITGASRPAGRNEKNPALLRIDTVNGQDPELAKSRPRFEDLTPLFPDEKLRLELRDDPSNMTARIIDLIAPIGKGQRGLIVSPPKAGKTTIMKQIARSIEINNPEVHLIVLLVDERPEEVTDMRRWLIRGEVAASTFDRPADEHIAVAELTIERAKRMVESGKDVCIILDGITRLARAYNLGAPQTGRIMSGGIDTGALYPPKKFFGAARNVEEGGSLTILATALVETGSRMDEVIFEEFKGTGNMELRLDRRLAERRIFPAIDVDASSTRHEELLFERKQLQQVWKLRRVLSGLRSDGDGGAAAGLELLIDRLKTFKSNDEFLAEVAKGPSA